MEGHGERREASDQVDQRMGKIDVSELERGCENAVVSPVGGAEPDQDCCKRPLRPRAPTPGGEGEEHEGERLRIDPVCLEKFEHTAA